MRDVQKLRELLERVEAATGPDPVLDMEIGETLNAAREDFIWTMKGRESVFSYERVTASLDASTALVERMLPGWGRMAYWNNCQGHLCAVEDNENSYKGSTNQAFEALGATSALALLAAMFKALISQAEGEGVQHG